MKYFYVKVYILVISGCLPNFAITNEKRYIQKRSIISNLNKGIKYAGHIFGINTAADVANLISKGFSRAKSTLHSDELNEYNKENGGGTINRKKNVSKKMNFSGVIASLLQSIHFDISKLESLALSTILGIAEMIVSLVLSKKTYQFKIKDLKESNFKLEEKNSHKDSRHNNININKLFEIFLHQSSPKFLALLAKATSKDLPEQLILMIESIEEKEHQAACVKILLCKCTPFIWNMQKSLVKHLTNHNLYEKLNENQLNSQNTNDNKIFHVNVLFEELPSQMEFLAHEKLCSNRYANFCNIMQTPYGNNDNNNKC